jgi:hypothetical protein
MTYNEGHEDELTSSPTPGSTVHEDQLKVTMPELIPQLKGKLQHSKYTCAMIFIDKFSNKDFVYCQMKMNTKQTLEAKAHCEQHFREHSVTIQHYHSDNGQFYNGEFCKSCLKANQKLTFCGVNAHHQNSITKNHIRELSRMSCSILLHAMQYHVVFDDNFTTVNDIENSLTPSTQQQLVSKYEGASEIDYDLAKLWFDCSDLRDLRVPPDGGNTDDQQDEQRLAALQVTEHNNVEQILSLIVPTEPPPKDNAGGAQAAAPQVNFTSDTNIPQGILHNPYPKTSYPSSSKTKQQKPEKVIKKLDYIDTIFSEMGYTPKKASSRLPPHPSTLSPSVSLHQKMLDQTLMELPNPMIHAGTANVDNDCLYYGQAMKANNRDDFHKAMSVELKAHIDQRHWVKMPRMALPKDMKPIKTVWSFNASATPMDRYSNAREGDQLLGKPIRPLCDGLPYDSC